MRGRTPEQWLIAAAVACLSLSLMRNLGVQSPVLPDVFDEFYNATEWLAIAVCALRTRRSSGDERAAWAAFTLGLLGFAAGDVTGPSR